MVEKKKKKLCGFTAVAFALFEEEVGYGDFLVSDTFLATVGEMVDLPVPAMARS